MGSDPSLNTKAGAALTGGARPKKMKREIIITEEVYAGGQVYPASDEPQEFGEGCADALVGMGKARYADEPEPVKKVAKKAAKKRTAKQEQPEDA